MPTTDREASQPRLRNVYSRNGDILGQAPKNCGLDVPPDLIRLILHDSGIFHPPEIDAWPEDEPIAVPPGVHTNTWVVEYAQRMGLKYKVVVVETKQRVLIFEHDGDEKEVRWARRGEVVSEEIEEGIKARL